MTREGVQLVKKLWDESRLGLAECKKAAELSNYDYTVAREILAERAKTQPLRDTPVELKAGHVVSYVHNNRIGALAEIRCETDFTANTPEFQQLCHDVTQQIVGTDPGNLDELLIQPWVRDMKQSVGQLVRDFSLKCGEKVRVIRFARYEIK